MANPTSRILSVDFQSDRVSYIPHGKSTVSVDRWPFLSKMDKIASLKMCGFRFDGNPMHKNNPALLAEYERAKAKFGDRIFKFGPEGTKEGEIPLPPKEAPITKEAPKVSEYVGRPEMDAARRDAIIPNPTTTKGGLDDLLVDIVRKVLGDFVPEVDPVAVADIVNKTMEPYTGRFGEVLTEVGNLREVVRTMQPKVTEVHLGNGEITKIDGVQHSVFPEVLVAVSERMPVYLVGPAGTGKSTIGENASKALGLDFYAKSCSAQTTESSLLGFIDANGNYIATAFRKAYENGGVFLLDEVDNGNPNVLSVLNSALANGVMAFPDRMVRRSDNFVAIATANTIGNGATAEYVGRNPLDKAFLDRFANIEVNYDPNVEEAMLKSVTGLDVATQEKWLRTVYKCRANVQSYGLKVVVSPRAIVNGAKLLRNNIPMNRVAELVILKGLKGDQAEKVMEGVGL